MRMTKAGAWFTRGCLLVAVTLWASGTGGQVSGPGQAARPNVVWFVVDDMSANFSCYGEKLIETPNVDRMAREGTRFSRAFVTAPVCSPSRSALITGMYQTSIGAHNHRSGRGELKIRLPGCTTSNTARTKTGSGARARNSAA